MTTIPSEKLAISLVNFLTRIDDHCCKLSNTQQPFGLCTVTPKSHYVQPPTKEIQAQLKEFARKHFEKNKLEGIYLRYWIPPLMPELKKDTESKTPSIDDYQLTFGIPQFDSKWQQIVIARNLIYCSSDPETYEYHDWFELQEEAIRLVPTVHQTVKELEIQANMKHGLQSDVMPVFESFIYGYGLTDKDKPLSHEDRKKWERKEIKWQDRYDRISSIIKPAKTVHELYVIARKTIASSRNTILKSIFWAFVGHIEKNLIILTDLPEDLKKKLLENLRQTKKRPMS